MKTIVELQDVHIKKNGKEILSIESLLIKKGELVAIVGPNGAGKTTLILIMAILLKPDSGQVLIDGEIVDYRADNSFLRRKISVVFQDPILFKLSVYKNIEIGLKLRGIPKSVRKEIIDKWMDNLKILDLRNRMPVFLSGGESQRVSLCRALVLNPDLLLLDEPFANLDLPTKTSLMNDIRRIVKEAGITLIFATHNVSEAINIANRVIVLNKGMIIQDGAISDVLTYPKDQFVAEFLGHETLLSAEVVSIKDGIGFFKLNTVSDIVIKAIYSGDSGDHVFLSIKPDSVILLKSDSGMPKSSVLNTFKGRVMEIRKMISFYKIIIDCGFILNSYITESSLENLGIKEGDEILTSFKATSVCVIKT